MEQSPLYQAMMRRAREEGRAEGRVEEACRILLMQGELKFGPPDARARTSIESVSDIEWLERMAVRLICSGSWDELLTPQIQRESGRQKSRAWWPRGRQATAWFVLADRRFGPDNGEIRRPARVGDRG
jgi:hypothetical protein